MTTPLYNVGELQQKNTEFLIKEINSRVNSVGLMIEKSADDLVRLWHGQSPNRDDVLDAEITLILNACNSFTDALDAIDK